MVYTIFDIIDNSLSYTKRLELIHLIPVYWGINLVKLFIIEVREFKYIDYFHQKHLDEGYEGSIIRNNTLMSLKGLIIFFKIKPTKEIICKVINLIEGTGKYEGMLGALTVETPDKKDF